MGKESGWLPRVVKYFLSPATACQGDSGWNRARVALTTRLSMKASSCVNWEDSRASVFEMIFFQGGHSGGLVQFKLAECKQRR